MKSEGLAYISRLALAPFEAVLGKSDSRGQSVSAIADIQHSSACCGAANAQRLKSKRMSNGKHSYGFRHRDPSFAILMVIRCRSCSLLTLNMQWQSGSLQALLIVLQAPHPLWSRDLLPA